MLPAPLPPFQSIMLTQIGAGAEKHFTLRRPLVCCRLAYADLFFSVSIA